MPEIFSTNPNPLLNSIVSLTGVLQQGNRVRVTVELNENHSKPNLALILCDSNQKEVSRSVIMGIIDNHVEFTLHIRVPEAHPPLTLTCISYLEEDQPLDSKSIEVTG